jgi:lysylphosphatidylglycerol synthetase-like protein (DUF2156 family)
MQSDCNKDRTGVFMTVSSEAKNIDFNAENRSDHLKIIRRWGGATSDAILDPSCHHYKETGIEGLVGYKLENQTAVAFGDPVCSLKDRQKLIAGFHHYCISQGWNILYLSSSEEFARWALHHGCHAIVQFGEEQYLDPHDDPRQRTGNHASLVRRKIRHALHEGATIQEYTQRDTNLEKEIDKVGISWLDARRGPQIHISNLRLFNDRLGKRWFYVRQGDKIVGAAVLNRLEKYEGWLLNHVIFTPDAPHGTPELLVVSALEAAAKDGCRYVTFGNSTASSLGEIQGLNTFSSLVAHAAFKLANKLFHLDEHRMFWDKFHPQSKPSYLIFAQSCIGIKELLALKNALNVSI